MKKKLIKIIALLAIIVSFGSISTSSDAASQYIYKTKVYCYVTDGYNTPDGKFFKLPCADENISAFGYGRPDELANADGKVVITFTNSGDTKLGSTTISISGDKPTAGTVTIDVNTGKITATGIKFANDTHTCSVGVDGKASC